jgi:hypothetical protein
MLLLATTPLLNYDVDMVNNLLKRKSVFVHEVYKTYFLYIGELPEGK